MTVQDNQADREGRTSCTCYSKPPDQSGYWDPGCPLHGTNSEGHKRAMARMDKEKKEREEQPSQDLWSGFS